MYQADLRDNLRPLNYRGRILEGSISKVAHKDHFWRHAALLRDGRTEPATQLASKDLVVIESMDEETDGLQVMDEKDYNNIQGGYKVEQVGQNACEKMLASMLSDLQLTGRSGIYIVDLNMSVGDMFGAFTVMRSQFNFPLFYLGATDCASTLEWFNESKVAFSLHQF